MEQLIATFHIDIPLVVAQVVNFAIVFFILYWFALKPLMKVMDKRSQDIENGLKNAELSEIKLAQAEQEQGQIIQDAEKQAKQVVIEAHNQATQERDSIIAQAYNDQAHIIAQAQEKIDHNREQASREFREQSAEIITSSMEQMFKGYVASGKGEQLIKEIIHPKI